MRTEVVHAHKEALKMWRWIEAHPSQNKRTYIGYKIKDPKIIMMLLHHHECWLCTTEDRCNDCALSIAEGTYTYLYSCEDGDQPYHIWNAAYNAKDLEGCTKYAGQVADKIQIWLDERS